MSHWFMRRIGMFKSIEHGPWSYSPSERKATGLYAVRRTDEARVRPSVSLITS